MNHKLKDEEKIVKKIEELYKKRLSLEKEIHKINLQLDILIAMIHYKEKVQEN